MKHLILSLILIATLFLSLPVTASPLDDKVAALKKAIKEEIAAKPKTGITGAPLPEYANAVYLVAALDQLTTQINDPNQGNNVEMEISQILSAYSSESVQKAGKDLIAEIQQERKDRAQAAATEIQVLLKRVSDEVTKAKKPEDLDGLLVDLQKYQNGRNSGYNQENQALYQQISSAFEFTKLWQNYLSHLANGQTQLATSDLQNLSQNNYAVGIIPRSQILALLADKSSLSPATSKPGEAPKISEAEKTIQGMNTLDDMEPALRQLGAMMESDPIARQYHDVLAPMIGVYLDLKAGLPASVNINFMGGPNGAGVPGKMKALLLNFILQHYFDTYHGAPPATDETPIAFVARVKADALSREDWPLLLKAASAHAHLVRDVSNSSYQGVTSETTGIDSLIAASNQETAGQYALAVVSYQNALKAANANVPAKAIGDKLAVIQKDHPKEYEDGMQMVISPSASRFYPGMTPSMPYRPGMPGYPMTQPNPSLAIPGANTNNVAAPAAPIPAPIPSSQPPAAHAPPSTNAPPAK